MRAGQSSPGAESRRPELKLRRATVLRFWCPACGAGPGQPCVIEGTGELRDKLHQARVHKAEDLIAAKLRAVGRFPAAAS